MDDILLENDLTNRHTIHRDAWGNGLFCLFRQIPVSFRAARSVQCICTRSRHSSFPSIAQWPDRIDPPRKRPVRSGCHPGRIGKFPSRSGELPDRINLSPEVPRTFLRVVRAFGITWPLAVFVVLRNLATIARNYFFENVQFVLSLSFWTKNFTMNTPMKYACAVWRFRRLWNASTIL